MNTLPHSIRATSFGLNYDSSFFSYNKKKKVYETNAANLGWEEGTCPEWFYMMRPEKMVQFDLMELIDQKPGRRSAVFDEKSFGRYIYVCEELGVAAIIYR